MKKRWAFSLKKTPFPQCLSSKGAYIFFGDCTSSTFATFTVPAPIKNAGLIQKLLFEPTHYVAFQPKTFTHVQ